MRITFAASECVPYINTGGLADVLGALPREVARQGHQVTMYLPFYKQVSAKVKERVVAIKSLTIPFQYYNRFVTVLNGGIQDGVQFYFIDCPELFDREYVYATPTGDYQDNWERFGLFCRAVLEASKQLGVPDVFHVHDWETAMLPVYLRTVYYFDPQLRSAGVMLTVHNAGYQGWFPPNTVERLLLPWEIYKPERAEHYSTLNFLKGGLVYSDVITTVSRKYAEEIQTAEFGNGLEDTFRRRATDLHGILNGIDTVKWDPATDGNIAAHYTAGNLEGKVSCRRDLLHAFGLEPAREDAPLLGIVSRFATQKGFDLIAQISDALAAEDLYLAVLGDGEPYYENLFRSLQERHRGKISVRIPYDRAMAHKVEAGADIFLMPSRYEPCGLGQLYSLRYGTIPVVRATGGLDEAVEEWSPETGQGTGFKFHGYNPGDFLAAIQRATHVFRTDKKAWSKLIHNAMTQDHSWIGPAAEYIELYEEVARRRS
ncbi:Glycogen synthase, ADP-glucose transglucosylase [Acidisarcina polymorpha]|uniref:Glycogen synthase n=1 Tax=Acidisarcina polymorpha TaxID=2211140 RepID=A0A2Z5G588_9BACT|nr:glycogen synthase GlgA [Acidisarcina polymorpha]AXC14241.1 Glycogen synthase, ADP-glucose transglucosylase [Acidisarcina polymorpha]